MAKVNNNKNPFKNKRNLRRQRALVRAEGQLKTNGYMLNDKLIHNTTERSKQLAHEIEVLKSRIVLV